MAYYSKLRLETSNRIRKIRLVTFSSYTLNQECLKKLLESYQDLTIVGQAITVVDLHTILLQEEIDIVVYCLCESQSNEKDLEFLSGFSQDFPEVSVLVLTEDNDPSIQLEAIKRGAAGIITKSQNPQNFYRAVRQISQGATWINQKLIAELLNNNEKGSASEENKFGKNSLTKREIEIINTLCQGLSNKEIGKFYRISEATVRHHLSSIYSKLYIADRLNLVIYAYQNDLSGTLDR